jgi:DNA polymerase III delta prime subunit
VSNIPTTGLRNLPLSQYLLRGQSANTVALYEEVRRLQEEQTALTPLTAGPFRLFMFDWQDAMLRSVGKDRQSIVASLNQGLEVHRIEPSGEGTGGTVVGFIDDGSIRIVMGHEPEPPAPADWKLLGLEGGVPQGTSLTRLNATWSVFTGPAGDLVSGNADEAFGQFIDEMRAHQAWAESWQPLTIKAGALVLHVSNRVRQEHALSAKMLDDLFDGNIDVFIVKRLPAHRGGKTGLLLFLPAHEVCLGVFPAPFEDAGFGHWLLSFLDNKPHGLAPVSRLSADWFPAYEADEVDELDENWLAEIPLAEAAHQQWKRTVWQPRTLSAGHFRVRISNQREEELMHRGITPEQLCASMNNGLHIYALVGQESDAVVAVPDGLGFRIRLTPYRPLVETSDWRLIDIRQTDSFMPVFARIDAQWEEGVRGRSPLTGDAAGLVRDLGILQDRRQDVAKRISIGIEWLAGNSPELSKRIASWREICEFERDLLEVGVTRLERDGQIYMLIPEDQEEVEEWIDGLENLNQQGLDWVRYPLELRLGEDHARLVIISITVAAAVGDELVLNVGCDNPRGRSLLDRLCDGLAGGAEMPDNCRLLLPDTQLRLIDNALSILDPSQKTRTQKAGFVGQDLIPDDMSVRTIQAILATANELDPIASSWPLLPVRPLVELSPRQEEAVRAAIFGPDMTLIQGPPGTGKTTVILEIIRQLFRMHGRNAGFKVLLVAPTHVAVDNVLERLAKPRNGSNLVMELGVAPYRVGSTRRIADHLRGFTPDCLNTKYREELERDVAQAVAGATRDCKRDRQVFQVLREGAMSDAASWTYAQRSGELLDTQPLRWPETLDDPWQAQVETQAGRVNVWRHWCALGNRPEERASLLQRWLDFLRTNPRFFSELLVANANLVCATTIGCATHRELRSVLYDYVIVDEAGKEEARRLLVPLIRGERWVLVGDHQQLPPHADESLKDWLIREKRDPKIITRSLFEELEAPFERHGRYVFLDRQGRMHPDISAFVSEQFYKGKLQNFPHAADRSIPHLPFLPDNPKLLVLDTGWLTDPSDRPNDRGKGFYNPAECELTVHLLRSAAKQPGWQWIAEPFSNTEPNSIGVIAPYRRQVEELIMMVKRDSTLRTLLAQGCLHIGTVDSFQGQEKDLIIFSSTRSNGHGEFRFADDRQRLNVALSRARARLIVLIDGSTVKRAQNRIAARAQRRAAPAGSEEEACSHLAKLLEHAGNHGGLIEVPSDWKAQWRG